MQTILGTNGVIGRELSKNLTQYTKEIKQVSRNPKKVNDTDSIFSADLLDYNQTEKAIEGSEITYLVAGLPYKTKLWQSEWPKLMRNVIDACKKLYPNINKAENQNPSIDKKKIEEDIKILAEIMELLKVEMNKLAK